jgi:MFS family permease
MVAGPFFVVYLLRDLHLTYLQYGLWLAAPILAQLITLQEWGRIADKFGNKKVLAVTGLAIPIIPMLYLCSTNWMVVVAINFLSGMLWPGFLLSLQNYVFDVVQVQDRAQGVAVYNTVNAFGTGAGAMLGSWLAVLAPSHVFLLGVALPLVSNLPIVFFASGVLRMVVSVTLLNTFREARTVTPISHRQLFKELPLIRPLAVVLGSRPSRTS